MSCISPGTNERNTACELISAAEVDFGSLSQAAYDPKVWHDFYLMVGGAAAALTGLILVAMSLHLAEIRASEIHRARANVSLLVLASKVALAGFVLMPGQPRQLLGAEIFLFGLWFGYLFIEFGRKVRYSGRGAYEQGRLRAILAAISIVVFLLSGPSLVVGWGGGLFLTGTTDLYALWLMVNTAWALVIGVEPTKRSH
jgi:hypothetical protein